MRSRTPSTLVLGLPEDLALTDAIWWYRHLRKTYFGADRHPGTYLVVETEAPLADVREALGERSFAPNWAFSYDEGENLNLARSVYDPHCASGTIYPWWQTHTRGWLDSTRERLSLNAHYELNPIVDGQTGPHIKGIGLDVDRGLLVLETALRDADLDPRTVQWTPSAASVTP